MNAMKYSEAELDQLLRDAADPVDRGRAYHHSAQVMLDRIVATAQSTTAGPRGHEVNTRGWRPAWLAGRWGLTGGAAVAVTAAVTAAVLLVPGSGAQSAYASWTADPGPLPAADAQAIADKCLPTYASILFGDAKPELGAATQVIGEKRGKYEYLYVVTAKGSTTCFRDSTGTVYDPSVFAAPVTAAELGTKGIELQGWGALKTSEGYARLMAGHLGSGVIGVDIAPKGKPVVHATVSNRYFLAWYPEAAPGHGGESIPTTLTLRLEDGGTVANLNPGDLMEQPYLGR